MKLTLKVGASTPQSALYHVTQIRLFNQNKGFRFLLFFIKDLFGHIRSLHFIRTSISPRMKPLLRLRSS